MGEGGQGKKEEEKKECKVQREKQRGRRAEKKVVGRKRSEQGKVLPYGQGWVQTNKMLPSLHNG